MPELKDVQYLPHALGKTVGEYNLESIIHTQQIQQRDVKELCVQENKKTTLFLDMNIEQDD